MAMNNMDDEYDYNRTTPSDFLGINQRLTGKVGKWSLLAGWETEGVGIVKGIRNIYVNCCKINHWIKTKIITN